MLANTLITPPAPGAILALVGHDSSPSQLIRRQAALGSPFVGPETRLFPHFSLGANLGFPLRVRGIKNRETQVAALLNLLGMIDHQARMPASLTATETRKLTIARALITKPDLLLLDDPLANLPASGRETITALLRRIQTSAPRLAMIIATADPEFALGLATEIALVADQTILQRTTPRSLYNEPDSPEAARLSGRINLLPGHIRSLDNDIAEIQLDDSKAIVEALAPAHAAPGMACILAIRPERVAVAPASLASLADDPDQGLIATLRHIIFEGDTLRLQLDLPNGDPFTVRRPAAIPLGTIKPGQKLALAWQASNARTLIAS